MLKRGIYFDYLKRIFYEKLFITIIFLLVCFRLLGTTHILPKYLYDRVSVDSDGIVLIFNIATVFNPNDYILFSIIKESYTETIVIENHEKIKLYKNKNILCFRINKQDVNAQHITDDNPIWTVMLYNKKNFREEWYISHSKKECKKFDMIKDKLANNENK